jgi:hypothetical protein
VPISYAEKTSRELKALICDELGFVRKHDVLWRPISKDVRGFLGLGRATYGSSLLVEMFPTIGIRFEPVFQLEVLLGANPNSKTGCNVGERLEYLVPGKSEYSFRRDKDNTATAVRLIADIKAYVLPFYEKYSSIESVLNAIKLESAFDGDQHTFVPVAYYYLGNCAAAIEKAEQYAKGFDPRRQTGKQYYAFVENLRNAMANRV